MKDFNQKKAKKGLCVKKKNRQRATFAYAIIAAVVLNFCVRDGYRCVHHAIITGFFFFLKDKSFKTRYMTSCSVFLVEFL